MNEAEATLVAEDLSRSFGPVTAVRGVGFALRRGEVLGLLGPNGAGKTTTMQMLTGNLAPGAGSVSICGIDLLESPRRAKARLGYLPENPPLYRDFSVDEFLRLAARLHRVPRARVGAAVETVKSRCGLAEVGRRLVGALSKGFQQRVGIAQAIVHEPDVVILDEPTVGLDPIQIREIRTLIRELAEGRSVILSSHILPEVEQVCDRVQIMHRGSTVYAGDIAGLKSLRRGSALLLGLHQPPLASELAALPGVGGVEELGDDRFRLLHEPGRDPAEQILRLAVERGWRPYMASPEQATLEDVFVHLTQSEEGGQ